jgi:peptide methionine sulfoxide reductase msrA/msrB
LEIFWRNIDPTTENAQFADQGTQYRTAIFLPFGRSEKRRPWRRRDKLADSGKFSGGIVTEIVPAGVFYLAEEEHQDYFKKQPFRYNRYKEGSGRAGYLKRTWPDAKKQ